MIRLSVALVASLIPALAAAPAWSQPMDHSKMPGMQMPPEPETPTPDEPAPPPPMDHSNMPGMEMPAPPEQAPIGGAPAATPAAPVDHSNMPGMDHSSMPGIGTPGTPESPAPATQLTGADLAVGDAPAPPPPTKRAADPYYDPVRMVRAVELLGREHGGGRYWKVMANIAEFQARPGEDGFRWDGEAWYGGDLNRLVIKTEGDGGEDGVEEAEVQVLYSRAISPLFDLQAGIRQDLEPASRTYATIGFEGMAPYWFDVEGALFLSTRGDLLARLEGSYDLRLTQKWIVQGRAEANLSAQDVRELGIGSGFSNAELGLRLRYEIQRSFAPYIGVTYDRSFGATADFARAAGKRESTTSFVFGVRAWF
jgi:copper resistance protein B